MNILLHSPLHPAYWNYLMRNLPEHNWFIEPRTDFEEACIPFKDLNYTIIPRKTTEKMDVQIILLHFSKIPEILNTFHIPVVWLEYWRTTYRLPLPGNYPLVYTSQFSHRKIDEYQNIRHCYPVPSKQIWNRSWIGDKPEVFCPVRASYILGRKTVKKVKKIIDYLEDQKLPMKLYKTQSRTISFKEWQNNFIHSRVLLEATGKNSSFTLFEAMKIGMPVVTLDWKEFPYIVRNGKDGYRNNNPQELHKILKEFLVNYPLAKKMGQRAKKRSNMILNLKKERKVWNKAFKDAIKIFNKTGNWGIIK